MCFQLIFVLDCKSKTKVVQSLYYAEGSERAKNCDPRRRKTTYISVITCVCVCVSCKSTYCCYFCGHVPSPSCQPFNLHRIKPIFVSYTRSRLMAIKSSKYRTHTTSARQRQESHESQRMCGDVVVNRAESQTFSASSFSSLAQCVRSGVLPRFNPHLFTQSATCKIRLQNVFLY